MKIQPTITPSQPPLQDQPWFLELMSSKGFTRTSSNTFTRGMLQVRVAGALYVSDERQPNWISRADYGGGHSMTISSMVDIMLETANINNE